VRQALDKSTHNSGIWRLQAIIYKIHCLHHFIKQQSNWYFPYFCHNEYLTGTLFSMMERKRRSRMNQIVALATDTEGRKEKKRKEKKKMVCSH
jgi:hypothetical protein